LASILKQVCDPLAQTSAPALVALSRSTLVGLLMRRAAVLERRDPTGEDRAWETASLAPISLKRLFGADG